MTSNVPVVELSTLRYNGMLFYVKNEADNKKSIILQKDTQCLKSDDTNHLRMCSGGCDCSEYDTFMKKAICYFKKNGLL